MVTTTVLIALMRRMPARTVCVHPSGASLTVRAPWRVEPVSVLKGKKLAMTHEHALIGMNAKNGDFVIKSVRILTDHSNVPVLKAMN